MKSFRDPVYNYIRCAKSELSIIDSPWFQRLRHCTQNGPARLVYRNRSRVVNMDYGPNNDGNGWSEK